MICRYLCVVLLLTGALGISAKRVFAGDDIPRAVIETGKRATAMVETKEATGTAFCIDYDGYFVTNEHVVGDNARVTLILNSGETDQKVVFATVMERDAKRDLVLLKADGKGPWKPLLLAPNNAVLIETTPLVAFGFPFGRDLSTENGRYPAITVSTGRVTALRKEKGVLVGIQLDASLTPGSSGGPVMDQQGRVIGIVEKGIEGSTLNFAIPVDYLQMLLLRPHITPTSEIIPRSRMHLPNAIRFQVAPGNGHRIDYQVILTLNPHSDHPRSLPMVSSGGNTYTVTTVLFPQQLPAANLRLVVEGSEGSFVMMTPDREITVGARKVRLHEITSIANGSSPSVHLRSGMDLSGTIVGIHDIPGVLNGVSARVDLSRAAKVTLEDAAPPPGFVEYLLTVKKGEQTLETREGTLLLEDNPGEASQGVLPKGAVLGKPVFFSNSGHWYRSVIVPDDITWTAARRTAERLTYQGWRGHLVTITSEEENRFVAGAFPEGMNIIYWLGGFQDKTASDYREPDGGWRWVTGEKWSYSNWNLGLYQEPNDGLGGHEDYLGLLGNGRWNDLPDVRTDPMRGLIVEFEK